MGSRDETTKGWDTAARKRNVKFFLTLKQEEKEQRKKEESELQSTFCRAQQCRLDPSTHTLLSLKWSSRTDARYIVQGVV
jgi:hypothetical protein